MTRRLVRLPGDEPMLDIFSYGHPGPARRLTPRQIQQITRTVRRVPEVMVKVTGGGANAGAVGAHFSYIGRHGQLEIETDYGVRIAAQEEQKTLLADWHLELSAGQYRGEQEEKKKPRKRKKARPISRCRFSISPMPASRR